MVLSEYCRHYYNYLRLKSRFFYPNKTYITTSTKYVLIRLLTIQNFFCTLLREFPEYIGVSLWRDYSDNTTITSKNLSSIELNNSTKFQLFVGENVFHNLVPRLELNLQTTKNWSLKIKVVKKKLLVTLTNCSDRSCYSWILFIREIEFEAYENMPHLSGIRTDDRWVKGQNVFVS